MPSEKHTLLLLIDDNPKFAEDIRALTGDEFHLVTAASGEEGLRQLSGCSRGITKQFGTAKTQPAKRFQAAFISTKCKPENLWQSKRAY